jgi:hypothetical protein
MTKLIGDPIKVHLDKDLLPDAFIWRKRVYRVTEVLSWWREPAEWWKGQKMRFFIRVNANNTSIGTFELSRLGESWFLDRLYD